MVNNYKVLKYIYKNLEVFKQAYSENLGKDIIDAEIRVNWRCNAQCVMCGLKDYIDLCDSERSKEMSYESIERLLLDLHDLGCKGVTFSGGEPTIRTDMAQIIEFAAHKCNMVVSINTNGYCLDEKKLNSYIEAGLSNITLSILSPDAQVNNRLMGLKNGLEHSKRVIQHVNGIKDKKVNVYINTVVLKQNIDTFELFTDFIEKYPIEHLTFSPASILTDWDEWTAKNDELRPTVEQIIKLKEKVIPYINSFNFPFVVDDPFGADEMEIKNNLNAIFSDRNSKCYIPWAHTVIQSNGDVIPCCYAPDDYIMGNIFEDSIKTIWKGDKYKVFRGNCKKCNMPMCKSCLQYQRINRTVESKLRT